MADKHHEVFANLLENPTRVELRKLFIDNIGESNHLDFKSEWIPYNKIARHVLALANSGGGAIIFGVKEENGLYEYKGLDSFNDTADVSKGLDKLLPFDSLCNLYNFDLSETEYDKIEGNYFQMLIVANDEKKIPILPKKDGEGISSSAIYVRTGTESKEANKEQLENIINRRIESGYSSKEGLNIAEHLDQLEELYSRIQRKKPAYFGLTGAAAALIFGEDFDYYNFIEKLIEKKQARINQELGLDP